MEEVIFDLNNPIDRYLHMMWIDGIIDLSDVNLAQRCIERGLNRMSR